MNHLTYMYFMFLVILALSVTLFQGFDSTWNYDFVRNLLMFLSILPASIRFSLTYSKLLITDKIEKDS